MSQLTVTDYKVDETLSELLWVRLVVISACVSFQHSRAISQSSCARIPRIRNGEFKVAISRSGEGSALAAFGEHRLAQLPRSSDGFQQNSSPIGFDSEKKKLSWQEQADKKAMPKSSTAAMC
jgi:hypothetical protein